MIGRHLIFGPKTSSSLLHCSPTLSYTRQVLLIFLFFFNMSSVLCFCFTLLVRAFFFLLQVTWYLARQARSERHWRARPGPISCGRICLHEPKLDALSLLGRYCDLPWQPPYCLHFLACF